MGADAMCITMVKVVTAVDCSNTLNTHNSYSSLEGAMKLKSASLELPFPMQSYSANFFRTPKNKTMDYRPWFFGLKMKILTSGENDCTGKGISRGAE